MPDLSGSGTTETAWRSWPGLCPPRWPIDTPEHVVLAAPHPDDEVLGAGGTLAQWAGQGSSITIVAVTDGERSHPDSRTWARHALGQHRRVESKAAWSQLGLDDCHTVRLACRDGAVAGNEPLLCGALSKLCTPRTLCLSTWRHDGHPDHEATGRAAQRAAAESGARYAGYPIWMWHWASPADPRVPWRRARSVALDATAVGAKRRAAEEFVTQTEPLSPDPADQPVLTEHVLARLLREFEVFFL
ncbi:PIG-L deacetylase family protein [Sciscionella sediminilitoris]|uniref:PIG-L deacetylase family protein n=1 Tax=Sciscionella sediminilitoris TaxID=1445613 RepID=UPI0004DEFFFD|nr:PIG-L family deacetylase [Sciscionella sp. SE31]